MAAIIAAGCARVHACLSLLREGVTALQSGSVQHDGVRHYVGQNVVCSCALVIIIAAAGSFVVRHHCLVHACMHVCHKHVCMVHSFMHTCVQACMHGARHALWLCEVTAGDNLVAYCSVKLSTGYKVEHES